MGSGVVWLEVAALESRWEESLRLAADSKSARVPVLALQGHWNAWRSAARGVDALLAVNAVSIAVCEGSPSGGVESLPDALAACDLRVIISDPDAEQGGAISGHWNRIVHARSAAQDWIGDIASRIRTAGPAALVCARTLRLTARSPVVQGLVIESMAYALLQGSARHRQWLAGRMR